MVVTSPRHADPGSDNDSISLTSTIASTHSENELFEVKRILAENPNGKNTSFLIQWEGYPISRATWEPRKQIRHLRPVIKEWRERKKLEESGICESFDTFSWATAREESEDERQCRKIRRATKRKRLQRAANPELEWDLQKNSTRITGKNKDIQVADENISKDLVKEEYKIGSQQTDRASPIRKRNRKRRKIISDDDSDDSSNNEPLMRKTVSPNRPSPRSAIVSQAKPQSLDPTATKNIKNNCLSPPDSPENTFTKLTAKQRRSSSPFSSLPPSSSDESLSQIIRRSRLLHSTSHSRSIKSKSPEKEISITSRSSSISNSNEDIPLVEKIKQSNKERVIKGSLNISEENSTIVSRNGYICENGLMIQDSQKPMKGKLLEGHYQNTSSNSKSLKNQSSKIKKNREISSVKKIKDDIQKRSKTSHCNIKAEKIRKVSDPNIIAEKIPGHKDLFNLANSSTLDLSNQKDLALPIQEMLKCQKETSNAALNIENKNFRKQEKINPYNQDSIQTECNPGTQDCFRNRNDITYHDSNIKDFSTTSQTSHQSLHEDKIQDPTNFKVHQSHLVGYQPSKPQNSLDFRKHRNPTTQGIQTDQIIEDQRSNINSLNVFLESERPNPLIHDKNHTLQTFNQVLKLDSPLSSRSLDSKSVNEDSVKPPSPISRLQRNNLNVKESKCASTYDLSLKTSLTFNKKSFSKEQKQSKSLEHPTAQETQICSDNDTPSETRNRLSDHLKSNISSQISHTLAESEKTNSGTKIPETDVSFETSALMEETAQLYSDHNPNRQLQNSILNLSLESSSNFGYDPKFSQEGGPKIQDNKNTTDLVKEVVLGTEGLLVPALKFRNFEICTERRLKESIAAVDKILFSQSCIAQDLQAQYNIANSPILWQENLSVVDQNDPEATKMIEMIFNELVIRCSGLLAIVDNFVILMFPVKREEWRFIDQSSEGSLGFRLRYSIFSKNFCKKQEINSDIGVELISQPSLLPCEAQKKLIMMLLRHFIPRDKNCSNCKFYLLFPPSASQMANFVKFCLLRYNSDFRIYGSMTEGSWDKFHQSQPLIQTNDSQEESHSKIVLIHELVVTELFRIPQLSTILNYSNTTFWQFSDDYSRYTLYPSRNSLPTRGLGKINATELFPNGCAVFLSPSFLVAEPRSAYEFIRWFIRRKIKRLVPPCKLVGAHNLCSFLLNVAKSKASEAASYEKRHAKNPKKNIVLRERHLDYYTCNLRWGLYAELSKLNEFYIENVGYYENYENNLIEAPSMINPENEHELIRWFAAWSILNSDIFRKFIVIGTGSSNAPQAKYLKEFPLEKNKSLPITDTITFPNSTNINVEANNSEGRKLDEKSNKSIAASTLDAIISETSMWKNHTCSDKTPMTKMKMTHGDQRNSMNASSENLESFKNDQNTLNLGLSKESSETGSLINTVVMPHAKNSESDRINLPHEKEIHLDTDQMNEISTSCRAWDSFMDIEQSKTKLRELKFEATTEWYQRLRDRGGGWEHIIVTDHIDAWKILGFVTH